MARKYVPTPPPGPPAPAPPPNDVASLCRDGASDAPPSSAPDPARTLGPWIEPDGDDPVGLTLRRRRTATASGADLTASEREIAQAILAGQSNAEIARRRGRAVRTVANQIAGLYRKLGVSSRTELVARWANRPERD